MPEDEQQAAIMATVVETDEEPFIPEQTIKIEAVLEPEEIEQSTYWDPDYLDWWKTLSPPYIPKYGALPDFEDRPKELIINIETTRIKPWEGKIICIGVLDPNSLAPETMNFLRETEEETLNEFLKWFAATEYTTLIGYNLSFDYRFLYVAMQKYRKNVARWKEMKLFDVMQQQQQVKQAFVYGKPPSGKLEDWATLLLGTKPYAKQSQVYRWWREKNIEEIMNFNADKLVKTYFLWVLGKVVDETIPGAEVLGRPAAPTEATPEGTLPGGSSAEVETIEVPCPNCLQKQEMPKAAKVIECIVCGTPISNPAL